MPPKPKFTREQMVETARELGAALGSSARPIFTVFRCMDELQAAVREAAMQRFEQFVRQPMPGMPVFKQVGMQMVRFAQQEPRLYRLLFMQENGGVSDFGSMFDMLGATAVSCVEAICRDYGLSPDAARTLFEDVWIYTFGIGALCAAGACRFSEEKLSQMLTMEFQAMIRFIGTEKSDH